MMIRPSVRADIPALQDVLAATGLFPAEMLPDMMGFWTAGDEGSYWLTAEEGGKALGFCHARPEALTEGTWNMLAIAVHPQAQGRKLGSALVDALEKVLHKAGQRILLADTSGTAAFAQTREFYRKNGYAEEARIRDFWAEGDDKVTFRKTLKML
ncbi:MAG: N-acetyltransferase [Rhodobacterales bacterium]|nr:MAG: N-acetyltransferase [Rhodobacterales bacterium]